jgi:hypothetical protein
VFKQYSQRRDPFENLILGRVDKRLRKYLARGGEGVLRKFIQEEILAKTPDPGEEIAKLKSELAALEIEANQRLDLGRIRARGQEFQPRLADLQRVHLQPVDLEADTRDALA